MQKAVYPCILPILTYGAPVLWLSRLRKDKKVRNIKNSMEKHCRKLDKSQNMALCAIFLVLKTTPVKIPQREAATAPIYHTLDHLCELAAFRIHRLETKHPLRRKTKDANLSSQPTRLEKFAKKYPARIEFSDPLLD